MYVNQVPFSTTNYKFKFNRAFVGNINDIENTVIGVKEPIYPNGAIQHMFLRMPYGQDLH